MIRTGDRFGRLIAIELASSRPFRWLVKCDCGNTKIVRACSLTDNQTRSCGCLHRELISARRTSHGESSNGRKTPEYVAWLAIIDRCCNPRHKYWDCYGGRGINICEEWRHSFPKFLEHVGRRPSPELSIDRINNDRGYEPGNVRWATRSQQNSNKRRSRRTSP